MSTIRSNFQQSEVKISPPIFAVANIATLKEILYDSAPPQYTPGWEPVIPAKRPR